MEQYYYNNIIIGKILIKLDDDLLQIVINSINWIDW